MFKFKIGFVALLTLSLCLPLTAQTIEPQPDGDGEVPRPDLGLINDVDDALAKEAQQVGKTWIGVLCADVDAALRVHLDVPEGVGLMVDEVVDNSPASKLGLQKYDILTAVDGQPLTSARELVEHVSNAGENALQLTWLRKGKEIQGAVVPEPRPADQQIVELQRFGPGNQNFDRLRKWLEKAEQGENEEGQAGPFGFRKFGPEMPLRNFQWHNLNQDMPANLSVTVTRSGDELAKVTVKRGDDTWKLTEDQLDQLPDDVRPFVENQVRGSGGFEIQGMNQQLPKHLQELMKEMPWQNMNQEFERIQEQMDRMFNELRELKELQPQPEVEDDDTIDA
jgi:membrane-associated protease RseP (regulator of RpoE activity)